MLALQFLLILLVCTFLPYNGTHHLHSFVDVPPTKIRMWNWNLHKFCCVFWLVLFFPPRQGPARLKHVKPISCEAFLASACATFDCNSPMPARPWTEVCRGKSGLGLRSWKGLTTRIWWFFLGGRKHKQENSTSGNWCGGKSKQKNSTFGENGENVKKGLYETLKKRIVGLKNHYESR